MGQAHDGSTCRYRIRVVSELDAHWTSRLDGWQPQTASGTTILERDKVDQAALYGLLLLLRDLGLVLLAVERLDTS